MYIYIHVYVYVYCILYIVYCILYISIHYIISHGEELQQLDGTYVNRATKVPETMLWRLLKVQHAT